MIDGQALPSPNNPSPCKKQKQKHKKKHFLMLFLPFLKTQPTCILQAGTGQRKCGCACGQSLHSDNLAHSPCLPGEALCPSLQGEALQHSSLTLELLIL